MIYPKEEPNMRNVRVWSNDALDELDRELLELLKHNRNRKKQEPETDRKTEEYSGTMRMLEYFLLILSAIVLWSAFVFYTLQFLQFPTQRYAWWVRGVYVLPIVCIFIVTSLIDCLYDKQLEKIKQKVS